MTLWSNILGGVSNASELQRLQARRIACLEAELVHLEDRIARAHADGEEPSAADLDLYERLANGQRRHCEALGWQRTPRDITPTHGLIVRWRTPEEEQAAPRWPKPGTAAQ